MRFRKAHHSPLGHDHVVPSLPDVPLSPQRQRQLPFSIINSHPGSASCHVENGPISCQDRLHPPISDLLSPPPRPSTTTQHALSLRPSPSNRCQTLSTSSSQLLRGRATRVSGSWRAIPASGSRRATRASRGLRASLLLTLALFLLLDALLSSSSSVSAAKTGSKKKAKSVDEAAVKSKCSVCRNLVDKFMKGLEKTKKSGYGGGNTAWEEKSLGKNSFAKSETRFVEVMEHVCEGVSGETDKFYCGNIVEEKEDEIEEWYQSEQETPLEQTLCVESLKVCCPYGSYGSDCTRCQDADGVVCNGRGECKGNGTRVGNGKCDCQWPYKGNSCENCQKGYFHDAQHSNETHRICEKCHSACGDGGCKGPVALDCIDCASGYKAVIEDDEDDDDDDGEKSQEEKIRGCVDIDECATTQPCSSSEYCTNTEGSYDCSPCNEICHPHHGCTGGAANECTACRDGADWDADRKDCVVVDWTKYDESLEKQKEEENREEADQEADEHVEEQKEEEEAEKRIEEEEKKLAEEEAERMAEFRLRKEKLERELREGAEHADPGANKDEL